MYKFLNQIRQLNPRASFVAMTASAVLISLLWASLVKVDIIVRTEGRVVPAGKSQIVQHLEGGIVRNILVHEGELVKAPVSGIINRMSVTTIGGVIKPGEALMEITPNDDNVLIEAKARPNDRANLRSGLPARIRIGAYDYATFGTLEGNVTEVSADTLIDEREGRYYRVILKAKSQQHQMETVPGMTAIADVVVGKRTVISYLLSPLLRFSDRAFRDPK